MNEKPWDARLAYQLIYPLRNSRVSPNHLTFARLFFGLLAATCLASGDYLWTNLGAFFFLISNFLDHTDGELARLTNKTSKTGHIFDLASDVLVNIFLFVGIGVGLRYSDLGYWSLPMGVVSGLAVAAIFHMRNEIEKIMGKTDARQPHYMGIEAEDVLYLLPLVSLFEWLLPFLILATIGAPAFAFWVWREYLGLKEKP
jgi:archaetidylinositol phosphate synthase